MEKFSFQAKIEKLNSNVYHFHVKVPKEISDEILKTKNRRVICEIERKIKFQAALMALGNGEYFINLNKSVRRKINENEILHIELESDTSEFGMPFPVELEEVLQQEPIGHKHFYSLTKGKQRNLIFIINKYKNSDLRILKSIKMIEYLKESNGILDFKELNKALKNN